MSSKRASYFTIVLPTLICSAAVALSIALYLHEPIAALFALAGGICSSVICTLIIQKQSQRALWQLNNCELASRKKQPLGIYDELFDFYQNSLTQLQGTLEETVQLRAKLEAKLQVQNKQSIQLRQALFAIEQPLFIVDLQGHTRFKNRAIDRLIQRLITNSSSDSSNDHSENKSPHLLNQQDDIHLDLFPEIKNLLQDICDRSSASDRRSVDFQLTVDSEPIAYRAIAQCIRDDENSLLGISITLMCLQNENQERNRYAEFVSSVSHEFKTPMASIKALTELLIDGDVSEPEEQHEFYEFIDEQVNRLTRMVSNMLNLTRVESGVIKVQREDCELNDIIQQSIAVVKPTAEEKQITIIPELSDLYLAGHADRDLLGQVFINLLSNAVKYTPAGGEIRLRSRMDEAKAIIEIADTGMGIPADSLPHIFQRFYRVPENNQAASGSGLGLALVHYIVTELHNGEIIAQSTVGEGTTMAVTLPLGHQKFSQKSADKTECLIES